MTIIIVNNYMITLCKGGVKFMNYNNPQRYKNGD